MGRRLAETAAAMDGALATVTAALAALAASPVAQLVLAAVFYLDFAGTLRLRAAWRLPRSRVSLYNNRNTKIPETDEASLVSLAKYTALRHGRHSSNEVEREERIRLNPASRTQSPSPDASDGSCTAQWLKSTLIFIAQIRFHPSSSENLVFLLLGFHKRCNTLKAEVMFVIDTMLHTHCLIRLIV